MILTGINAVNKEILVSREHLNFLNFLKQNGVFLNKKQEQWVYNLANTYKIEKPNVYNNSTWRKLLRRVDIIPASMALAQSINESGWGSSYFAREGNNYFGQRCYNSDGCNGLIPKQRSKDEIFQLMKYSSPFASIRSYMMNINTEKAYHYFRVLRESLRDKHQTLSGIILASGLEHYSQLKTEYVERIKNIIQSYRLYMLDGL